MDDMLTQQHTPDNSVHAQTGTVCASQTVVHRKVKASYLSLYLVRERKCRSHGFNLHRVECLAEHEISCSRRFPGELNVRTHGMASV